MALMESFDRAVRAPKVQIFATDLNEAVLDTARAGKHVPPSAFRTLRFGESLHVRSVQL